MNAPGGDGLTCENPAGSLRIYQPRKGFRYAMEPFVLCGWALEGGRPATVVDLGTGSGIAALLLARLGHTCVGYDVRPEWVALARRSAAESGLPVPFELADVRDLPPADHDLALLNPPYQAAGSGPRSPDPWKAAARAELNGSLGELLAAAARLARRTCVVLPVRRAGAGLDGLRAAGLALRRRCDVDGSLVLLEAVRLREGEPGAVLEEQVWLRRGGLWSTRVRGWYAQLGATLGGVTAPDRPG